MAAGHLYFFGTHAGGTPKEQSGLLRVPRAGGAVETVDVWRGRSHSLIAQGGRLAWLTEREGWHVVLSRPVDAPLGADPTAHHQDSQGLSPLVANRHGLYWATPQVVYKLPHGAARPVVHLHLDEQPPSRWSPPTMPSTGRSTGAGIWKYPA